VAGKAGFSGDGGPATHARLDGPLELAMDAAPGGRPPQRASGAPRLFIADGYNARVRKVSPDGTITTVVGSSSTYGLGTAMRHGRRR
jgi:hypothetical protein